MNKVDPQHWQQVKEVFEGALECQGSARTDFLDRVCARDVTLREEVESLLRSYQEAGSFMESPAVAGAAESLVGEQKKLATGQLVKHYQVIAPIGEGGMGEVYVAKDTILGRRVALKLLPAYVGKDPDRLRRFKQEARSASTLNHPNVCVIHEIGETDDERPFIAMEHIEGVTLRQRMNERAMKLGDALEIAIQVANALTAAHEAGIVHRDVKPENIMIRNDGYVKVFDFGLAKLTDRRNSRENVTLSTLFVDSSPGTVMGTAAYMSPEQARGVTVDERTDIWSLGVVLYEIVSGRPPFVGQTPTDVVVAIVEKEPPPISKFLAAVPPELERIVRKALRKDPNERYQIVKEMAIDLRSLRKDLEIESQLDRSLAPAATGGAATASGKDQVVTPTGKDRSIDTDQLEANRLTTVGLPDTRRRRWPIRLGLTALVLTIIAGATFGIYKFTRGIEGRVPERFQRINVTKLTTNGNAIFASISPDGKYVAYVKSENGKESLWLRQVGSAGNLEVSPPREGHYQGVAFSPGGDSIYYGYTTSNANDAGEIFKVPVLGMGAPPVKVNPEEGPSSLSHDGKRIAFLRHSRANQTDTLVVARADGSEEQTLATRKWPDRFSWDWASAPAWTNDDQNLDLPLVKSDASGFYFSIYELHLADRAEKTIALSTMRFEQPNNVNILSDASAVLLAGRAQGASFEQIWYLGRDGSVRPLTNDLSDYRTVILTADSKSLVTTQTQTFGNIWVAPKGETAHAAQITAGLGRYFDLTWAPDGKIIFASDASGSADIYEIAANGSGLRQLTSGVKRNYAPAVSPDNRFIVFHSNRSGVFQVWRMDRDGNNPMQLTFGETESHWPQFSADGKFVYYQRFEPGESTSLFRISVAGGAPARVAEGYCIRPSVSPDGKWLAFWQSDGQTKSPWRLVLFSLESEREVKTFAMGPTVQINWDSFLRWKGDSQSLTYLDNRGGVDNLWAQPIDGSPAKQLTNFTDNKIFSFYWSREGTLVTSRGVTTSDVVLISDAGQ
jgi:serine/threonine protein kinase/Tol biopolymer transport system component